MGRNGFLEKQQQERQMYFNAGLEMGRQEILDMMSIVLKDPDIMGKDTFGKDRLLKVVKGIGDYIDVFQTAWEKDDEADYYRDKMDARLATIYGDGMHDTFSQRYQYCKDFNYKTGRWSK
jgi:hypothetical protein